MATTDPMGVAPRVLTCVIAFPCVLPTQRVDGGRTRARHSCGTAMPLRGVPLAVIAKWLGHADASITARIYAHSQDDALKAAGVTLAQVVAPLR